MVLLKLAEKVAKGDEQWIVKISRRICECLVALGCRNDCEGCVVDRLPKRYCVRLARLAEFGQLEAEGAVHYSSDVQSGCLTGGYWS